MKNFIFKILVLFALLAIQTNVNSQVQVTVEPCTVLTDISQDPVGLCLSYPNDDANFFPDRNRSTAEAFNSLNVNTLRFPMGTLADNYFWHEPGDYQNAVNGLKPRVASMDKAPGIWDWCVNADGSIKESSLDFDEYIDLCNSTGSEPVIMVNAWGHLHEGSTYSYQDIKTNAVEWVRYANVVKNLNIKYWEIGNELSVEVKKGKITPAEYVTLFRDFSDAMKAVDPTIKVGLGLGFNHFNEVLSQTYEKADFIVPHQYTSQYTNFDDYHNSTSPPNLNFINNANNSINNLPLPYRDNIEIMVTEFSSYSPNGSWKNSAGGNDNKNDIGKSMVTFEMLASALSSFDRISYMHFWVTHSPFGYGGFGDKYAYSFDQYLNTLNQGNAIAMYNRFKKDKMVETTSSSPLVRVYASYSENTKELTVYLINKSYNPEVVTIVADSHMELESGNIWTYTGVNGQADDKVTSISNTGLVVSQQKSYTVTLSPVSITAIDGALTPSTRAYFIDNPQGNIRIKSNQSGTDAELVDTTDKSCLSEWEIINAGSGFVYLQSLANGKKLQGTSSDFYLESAISLASSTNTDDQVKWRLTENSPGIYFIDNKAHNVRLFKNGSNEVTFGSTSWTDPLGQWKIANFNSEPLVIGEILSLTSFDKDATGLLISPNPVEDKKINIQYQLSEDSQILLEIYNLVGQIVFKPIQRLAPAGKHTRNINIPELPSGIYFMKMIVQSNNYSNPFIQTQKFVVK
jgi:alpha-L-arabinofuranosidase